MRPEAPASPAPGVALREATSADEPFLRALYRGVRAPELAQTAWGEERRRAFCDAQFDLQDQWYRSHYDGARFLVIERDGAPIGRLYLHRSAGELRVIDVALVAQARGQGLGTALVRGLQEDARRAGLALTLHVESFNPARALYARLGFRDDAVEGLYVRLRWDPATGG